jgi:hypothetical protein
VRKDLIRRLQRLEALRAKRIAAETEYQIVWVTRIPAERRSALAPGERIVTDEFGQWPGSVYQIERITTDPNDHGLELVNWPTEVDGMD